MHRYGFVIPEKIVQIIFTALPTCVILYIEIYPLCRDC
jgi:hypothetical protein